MRIKPTLVIFAAMALAGTQALAQEAVSPRQPAIEVNGLGEVRLDPDVATVRLGVQSQAKTAKEAQTRANAIAAAILVGIKKLGIDAKDIQTGSLQLFPVFPEIRSPQAAPTPVGYRAGNSISIRVLNLKQVGAVIDASVQAGANEIQGVEFGVKDQLNAQSEALKIAVKKARMKAVAIAEAAGVRLGNPLQITEGYSGGDPVMPMANMDMSVRSGAAGVSVQPGQVTVTATVTIRYSFTQ